MASSAYMPVTVRPCRSAYSVHALTCASMLASFCRSEENRAYITAFIFSHPFSAHASAWAVFYRNLLRCRLFFATCGKAVLTWFPQQVGEMRASSLARQHFSDKERHCSNIQHWRLSFDRFYRVSVLLIPLPKLVFPTSWEKSFPTSGESSVGL